MLWELCMGILVLDFQVGYPVQIFSQIYSLAYIGV